VPGSGAATGAPCGATGCPDLPYFYALKNYPFKSSAWSGVARLANNLIHSLCAERGGAGTFGVRRGPASGRSG